MALLHWLNKYRIIVGVLYFVTAMKYFSFWRADTAMANCVVALSLSSWVMATYLFNKVCDFEEDQVSQPTEKAHGGEQRWLAVLSFVLALAPVPLLWSFHQPVLLYLFFVPFGFLYSYPVVGYLRVKNLLFVKNVYWAYFGWYLPFVSFAHYGSLRALHPTSLAWEMLCGLPVFMLIVSYELLWDLRDVDGDRLACVMTVPVVFGVGYTKFLIFWWLAGLSVLVYFSRVYSLFPLIIYLVVLTILASPRRPGWFYHAMLYGQIALNLSVHQ